MSKLQDILVENGFDEATISKFQECINKCGEYIPKYRFDEVNNKKNSLEEQINTYDEQLKELKKFEGDNEELKKTIDKYKEDIKEIKNTHEKEMENFIKDSAIKQVLQENFYDADYALSKINKDLVSYDKATNQIVSGLNEQIEKLKETASWAVKKEDTPAPIGGGYVPPQGNPTPQPNPVEKSQAVLRAEMLAKMINNGGQENGKN